MGFTGIAGLLLGLAVGVTAAGGGVRPLAQGALSGIKKPARRVARTQAEWDQLWKEHTAGLEAFRAIPEPKVDFSRELVLAAFLGEKPTAGYSVEIQSAREQGGKLVVTVREKKPGPDTITAEVLTAPYHVVAVKKSAAPVEWRAVEAKAAGSPK